MFEKPTDAKLENRFRHHPPKADQADRYARIRAAAMEFAKVIRDLPPCCPDQTMAINTAHLAMMQANAAIATNE
jgi:hypothetical protein